MTTAMQLCATRAPTAPMLLRRPLLLRPQLLRPAASPWAVATGAAQPLLGRHASTSPPPSSSFTRSSASSNPSPAEALTPLRASAAAAANPPHTTRPPPLVLPERRADDSTSTFSHLLATGKAYLAFYKTGLRYLYANTKLVRAEGAASVDVAGTAAETTTASTAPGTRADLLLRRRWAHDMRRLPVFGLLLLICGEFTPFVVLVFPHVVPYPCRIPKQVDKLQRLAEERRATAFLSYAKASSSASSASASEIDPTPLIARSLNILPSVVDRLGLLGLARGAVHRRLRLLATDDALLRQAGGAAALVPDEVVLACAERGLDVRGHSVEGELRPRLATWLALTAPEPAAAAAATNGAPNASLERDSAVDERLVMLLTRRPEAWPRVRASST